jgi:hypothetical protein
MSPVTLHAIHAERSDAYMASDAEAKRSDELDKKAAPSARDLNEGQLEPRASG